MPFINIDVQKYYVPLGPLHPGPVVSTLFFLFVYSCMDIILAQETHEFGWIELSLRIFRCSHAILNIALSVGRDIIQLGLWNNSLNWRKVFRCLNFILQTWYLKYKLFTLYFCLWVFRLLWKPKLFFWTFITTRISIFWQILSRNIPQI